MNYLKCGLMVSFISLVITQNCFSQNVASLFETAPLLAENCEYAFEQARVSWDVETLDDGTTFKRVKEWNTGKELSAFGSEIEQMQEYVEKKSANNSFSLNFEPITDPEIIANMKSLKKITKEISETWKLYSSELKAFNPEFIPPNELENGCDQIKEVIKSLNADSEKINMLIVESKAALSPKIKQFQQYYDVAKTVSNPMTQNETLSYLNDLLIVFIDLSSCVTLANKNMVDTRVVLNNAMCLGSKG